MTENKNKTFEQIIKSRCSTRSFSKDTIPIECVNEIIQSGILAPYANPNGLSYNEIRKVFVFKQNTDSMTLARDILSSQIKRYSWMVQTISKVFPFQRKKFQHFAAKLNANSRIPALYDAPYFIVVAEKLGFPDNQKQSIGHCLQNMWLAATNLGLGFQMIFMTAALSKNKPFMKLLNLKKGAYAIDGCVIGYPLKNTDNRKEHKIDAFVTWIDSF
jgi:nitroreductase